LAANIPLSDVAAATAQFAADLYQCLEHPKQAIEAIYKE